MPLFPFPGESKMPHDGVGSDNSFRVGTGTGSLRVIPSDAILAETSGGPRSFSLPELTDDVRARCAAAIGNE